MHKKSYSKNAINSDKNKAVFNQKLIPIKVDLHLHAKEDPQDSHIKHSAKELIDIAAKKGFGALALTFHRTCYYPQKLKKYAEKKGIILISGAELSIEGKDVLIYNIKPGDEQKIKTFNDLKKFKITQKETIVIAPHPYFPTNYCLQENLEKNIKLFDGIELSWFYTKYINFNKNAMIISQKYNLPFIATSDLHYIKTFNKSFCTVYVTEKTPMAIFNALKNGNYKNTSSPLKLLFVISITIKAITDEFKKTIHNIGKKEKRQYIIR